MTSRRLIQKQSVMHPDSGILLGTKQEMTHQAMKRYGGNSKVYY